ncbi:MAG TPA: hypothetical protein DEB09_05345 [Candidatus Magasanikbacteria bacterium]|nr:hypothetical protein [Candidatus Magasanikbacteria bacterium]
MVKVAKKLFTLSVVTMTILWSVGVAALLPAVATAVDCPALEAGDLFKVPANTAVYLLNSDMERMYFPNGEVYHTWFADYSGVQEIAGTCVDAYPAPKTAPYGVNYRPGSRLVKVEISPSVYVIEPGNTKAKVGSEAVATALYGASWASLVRDVADVYWPNYAVDGTELATAGLHDGMLVKTSDTSKVYSIDGGMAYEVDGELGVAKGDVHTVTAALLAGVEMSTETVTAASLVEEPAQLEGMPATPGTDEPVATGDLKVALSASTPDANEIPMNLKGYTYVTLLATAGDEDVDVTGLTIKRKGLGDKNDFDKVYVEIDGVIHGSKRSLNSDGEAEVYFSTESTKITVPAGESVKIDIVADMHATDDNSGHSNYLQVTAVETTADLTASFPISGNKVTLSDVTAPTLTFAYTGDDADLTIGEEDVVVGEFTLDNTADEDLELSTVMFKQAGTADETEVTGYSLYYDDEVIAGPVDAATNDYVTFNLDENMLLEKDESDYEFVVKANVEGGNGDTVGLQLKEVTDIDAVGKENGFSVNVTGATFTGVTHTIGGGSLVLDEHKDNPAGKTYAPGTDDVVVLAAELEAADETVVVTSFDVVMTQGSGTVDDDELEALTVKLDGKTVCGPIDVVEADADVVMTDGSHLATITCDEEFEVKGTQKLTVEVNFTADADNTYTASIDNGSFEIEDLNGDALYSSGTTYDVSGGATGKAATLSAGTFSLSKDTKYTNKTITAGAEKYKIGSYVVKAPVSQAIKVKKYTVALNVAGNNLSLTDLTDLSVSEDTDVVSEPDGSDVFNVSQLLSAEQTKTVSVYATINSNVTGTISTTLAVQWRGETNEVTTDTTAVVGQTITVQDGALTPTLSSSNPDGDVVLSGTAAKKVFVVQFDADYDTYTLTDLNVVLSNPEAVTALTVGGVTVSDFVDGEAQFNGLNIAVTDKKQVEFTADFNTVSVDEGVDSGTTTTFKLSGYEASATQGEDLVKVDDDIAESVISEVYYMYASRPVLAFAKGAEAASNGLLSVGDNEMVKMTVTADGGTVNLLGITIEVDGAATTSVVSLLKSNGDVLATTTVDDLDSGAWTFDPTGTADLEVGTSKVYSLSINLATVADGAQVAFKVTGLDWDDDVASSALSDEFVEVLPSAKFLATENT